MGISKYWILEYKSSLCAQTYYYIYKYRYKQKRNIQLDQEMILV